MLVEMLRQARLHQDDGCKCWDMQLWQMNVASDSSAGVMVGWTSSRHQYATRLSATRTHAPHTVLPATRQS